MPPQNLQIGQNGVPSFAQQGQIDWVAFGNTVWNVSTAILQRFADWGIQPVTYGAGLALASRFRMSNSGRQRMAMDQAMPSLRGVPGLDKILWFGFGHQSFVKMMGDNQLGLNCIALCACLAEVYSEDTAACVLESLWDLNKFPEHYEPPYSQFFALVKACSGTVCRSRFGRTLDAMTGHGRWPFGPYREEHDHRHPLRASNAIDIARALDALFQITRGEIETITLLGQNECAFIAAFAHWLFDFTIYVEDEAGEVLFRSYEGLNREDAQVFVRYTKEAGTDVLIKFHADSSAVRRLQIASTIKTLTPTSVSLWDLSKPSQGENQRITRVKLNNPTREHVKGVDHRRKVPREDFGPRGRYRCEWFFSAISVSCRV